MIDLETVRDFFARAPFMVDLGVVPTAVSEGRQQRVLVAKLSATLAVVQPT